MSKEREIMAKNLQKYIDSKGIDQRILADYLGVSEMSVSNWVTGSKYPRINNIQKMADYFGVLKSDLIEVKEDKASYNTNNEYTYFPTAISAGLPLEVDGITESSKISASDEFLGKWANNKNIFFAHINGDSRLRSIKSIIIYILQTLI